MILPINSSNIIAQENVGPDFNFLGAKSWYCSRDEKASEGVKEGRHAKTFLEPWKDKGGDYSCVDSLLGDERRKRNKQRFRNQRFKAPRHIIH